MKNKFLLEITKNRFGKKYEIKLILLIVFCVCSLTLLSNVTFFVNKYFNSTEIANNEYVLKIGYKSNEFIDNFNKKYNYVLTNDQFKEIENTAINKVQWMELNLNYTDHLNSKDINFYLDDVNIKNSRSKIKAKFIMDKDSFALEKSDIHLLNEGFSADKREVMVSNKFLKDNNLDSSVLGKKISLSLDVNDYKPSQIVLNETDIENKVNYNFGEIYSFKDYVIVGIVKDEYYSHTYIEDNTDLWFKYDSLLNDKNELIIENLKESLGKVIATYPSDNIEQLAESEVNAGRFFPLFVTSYFTTTTNWLNNMYCPEVISYVEYGSLNQIEDAIFKIDGMYTKNGVYRRVFDHYSSRIRTEISFNNTRLFMEILLIFLFILNLLIIVIQLFDFNFMLLIKKKDFSAFLNKIGMLKKDRIKGIWIEYILIFIISGIISFLLSLFVIYNIVFFVNKYTTIVMELSFISCFITFILSYLFVTIVGMIINYITIRKNRNII